MLSALERAPRSGSLWRPEPVVPVFLEPEPTRQPRPGPVGPVPNSVSCDKSESSSWATRLCGPCTAGQGAFDLRRTPNLDARHSGIHGDRVHFPNSLADVRDGRHLNESQGEWRTHPCGDQIEGVENVGRLADPDRTTPLRAAHRRMNEIALALKFLPRHHL